MDADYGETGRQAQGDDCEAIWPMISLYADSEAGDFERILVETHIGQCASCSDELELLHKTCSIIRATPEIMPPAELRNRHISHL